MLLQLQQWRIGFQTRLIGGKLLAAGSACPFHPGSYLTPETDTYYGEALAVVEAGESGAVEVSISDGERSDTVKIPIA